MSKSHNSSAWVNVQASSDTLESEGWQMKHCWIKILKNLKNPPLKSGTKIWMFMRFQSSITCIVLSAPLVLLASFLCPVLFVAHGKFLALTLWKFCKSGLVRRECTLSSSAEATEIPWKQQTNFLRNCPPAHTGTNSIMSLTLIKNTCPPSIGHVPASRRHVSNDELARRRNFGRVTPETSSFFLFLIRCPRKFWRKIYISYTNLKFLRLGGHLLLRQAVYSVAKFIVPDWDDKVASELRLLYCCSQIHRSMTGG